MTQDNSEYFVIPHSFSADRLIDVNTSDEAFKANYSPEIAKRRSTLALKSSFHIINMILMGLSKVFRNIESTPTSNQAQITHRINLIEVMYELAHLCFYDISEGQCKTLEIIEYQPGIFRDLRRMQKITEDHLFQSFVPLHNIQAIHNFFTGSGKSSSFFFFSDNKQFVLKTIPEKERKLLLEQGLLIQYHKHLSEHRNSALSKIYGIFTIRLPAMEDVTCFIMDNLLGKDFMNIERIYDLKGSTKGRFAKLTPEEESGAQSTGMKVLKDLNLVCNGEKLDISDGLRAKLLRTLEQDSQFLMQNNLMDYSLLLIKARNDKNPSVIEHEMMPALVLLKEQNGEARLELRNSITIVKPGRKVSLDR